MATENTRADWIAVGVMQLQDADPREHQVDVDFEVTYDADWTKDGKLQYPEKILAKQALLRFQRSTGIAWGETFQWLARISTKAYLTIPVAGCFGVLLSWATWRGILMLSDTGRVPLFYFAGFLLWSMFWFGVTFSAQVLELIQCFLPSRYHRRKEGGWLVSIASGLQFLWQAILTRVLARVLKSKLDTKHTRQVDGLNSDRSQSIAALLRDLFQVLARPITTLTTVISHALWLAAQVTILFSLLTVMSCQQQYDFEWRETIISSQTKERVVDWIPTVDNPAKLACYLSMKPMEDGTSPDIPAWAIELDPAAEALLDELQKLSIAGLRASLARSEPPWDDQIEELHRLRQQADQINLDLSDTKPSERKWPADVVMAAGALEDGLASLAERLEVMGRNLDVAGEPLPTRLQALMNEVTALESQRRELSRMVRAEAESRSRERFMDSCRQDLGWSLIQLILLFGILPRFVSGVAAYLQYQWALRSLQPNLKQEYFLKIIQLLEQEPRGGSPEPPDPAPPDPPVGPQPPETPRPQGEPPEPSPPAPDPPPAPAPVPPPIEPPQPPQPPLPPPPANLLYVFSYEVTPPESGWMPMLRLNTLPNVRDLGEIDNRKTRMAAIESVQSAADSIVGLVTVVDYTDAPGEVLRQFFESLLACIPAPIRTTACVIIMTHGERARRKYRRPVDLQELQASWDRLADAIAVPRDRFLMFDHEHCTAESASRLQQEWSERWPQLLDSSADSHHTERYRQALELIVQSSRQAEQCRDETSLAELLQAMLQQIDAVYAAEAKRWHRSLRDAFGSWQEEATASFQDAEHLARAVETVRSKLAEVAQRGSQHLITGALAALQRLPRWQKAAILGTGILAVGGFTASGLAPLLAAGSAISPTFLGGVCATFGVGTATVFGALGVKRMLGTSTADDEDTDQDAMCLDDFVRSGIVRVVILELQGQSPASVADQLDSILGRCQEASVTTSEQAHRLCERVGELLATRLPSPD